jgi:hypothetical protein
MKKKAFRPLEMLFIFLMKKTYYYYMACIIR